MSNLINAGLVRRMNGKYFVTSFGKVVYKAQELIGMAVQYFAKLNAIDSIETPGFPIEERSNTINALINSSRIKEILISRHPNIPAEKDLVYDKGLIASAVISHIVNQL